MAPRCTGRGPRACGRRSRFRSAGWPHGLSALGLQTVGDLLEHLPSDSREARTVSTLRAGEPATVAVHGAHASHRARSGAAACGRSSRRRCSTRQRTMRATFFNQPWLVERYPPGTRLLLHGQADDRGGFAVSHTSLARPRRPAREQDAPARAGEGDSVAHYPRIGRGQLDGDPHPRACGRGDAPRRARGAAGRDPRRRGPARPPERARGDAFPDARRPTSSRAAQARIRGDAANPAPVPAQARTARADAPEPPS